MTAGAYGAVQSDSYRTLVPEVPINAMVRRGSRWDGLIAMDRQTPWL